MSLYRRYCLWRAGMSEAEAQFIASREWLQSREWALIRYDCMEYYKASCIACGRNYREHGVSINLDHYKPRKTHPWLATTKSNIVPLCSTCNMGKCNKKATDWRKRQGYWRHLWLALKG